MGGSRTRVRRCCADRATPHAASPSRPLLAWPHLPRPQALTAHGGRALGGRSLVQHSFGNASVDIETMQRADLVIAVHGAGSVNLWFLRPGAAWIDLLPARVPTFQPVMLALAQRFGVRFATQPLKDENVTYHKPHDAPYYGVDVNALAGLVSLMVGAEP